MIDILQRRLVPSRDVATSAVGDETVILHLGRGIYFGLDRVGTRFWELLNEGVQAREICRRVADEFDASISRIEDDARLFLSDLESQGLLVDASD